MKKIVWSWKILISLLLLGGVIIASAGIPRWLHLGKPPVVNKPPAAATPVFGKKEEGLVRQLIAVTAHMESCPEMFISGTFNIKDPSDGTADTRQPFRLCRKGNALYYQNGDMETVALEDVYINISKDAQKMIVGPARKIVSPFQFPSDTVVQFWKSEGYTISGETHAEVSTIRMLRENHVSCKEYRYDYDSSAMVMKRIYMRLTNLRDPLNSSMDKEMTIMIDQWKEKDIPTSLLRRNTYLVKKADGWEPAGEYTGYTVVSL